MLSTMPVESPAASETKSSWWPDKTKARPNSGVALLGLGLLSLVWALLAQMLGLSSDASVPAIVGLASIAIAGFQVAKPIEDRVAVFIYRAANFLIPLAGMIALFLTW